MAGNLISGLTTTNLEAQQNIKRLIEIRRPKENVEDDAFGFITSDEEDDDEEVMGAEALRPDEGKVSATDLTPVVEQKQEEEDNNLDELIDGLT